MCVDYTDLNRAYPENSYSLPNIDKLVDNSAKYKLLTFMDAYSRYKQIPMFGTNRKNTVFMTEQANQQYNVTPLRLKNACARYPRMMNNAFREEIGETLEVYMDDTIVMFEQEEFYDKYV